MGNEEYDGSYMQLVGKIDRITLGLKYVPRVLISMTEARKRGLLFYYTDKPCKNGQYAPKFANDRTCVKCEAFYPPVERNIKR